MKHFILTLFLYSSTFVFAQLPSKMEDLRSKRDKAIENINNIYRQELQKLLVDDSIANDTEQLAQIQKELGILPNTVVDYRDFVGKPWMTLAKSIFMFNEDKSGTFTQQQNIIHFKWKKRGDIVEIEDLSKSFKWFFIFKKDSVLFGVSEISIDQKIILGDLK